MNTNENSLSDNSSEVHSNSLRNSVGSSSKLGMPRRSYGSHGPGGGPYAIYNQLKNVPIPKDTTYTKIFVGGLPYHTTDESLARHFEVYGKIGEAVVITERQTGKSRGYGFVTMADKAGAAKACINPNPIIDGRKANVNLAYIGAKPRIMHQNLLFRGLAATLAAAGMENNQAQQQPAQQQAVAQQNTPYVVLGQTPPVLVQNHGKASAAYIASNAAAGNAPTQMATLPPGYILAQNGTIIPTGAGQPQVVYTPQAYPQVAAGTDPYGNQSTSNGPSTAQQVALLDYMIKSQMVVQGAVPGLTHVAVAPDYAVSQPSMKQELSVQTHEPVTGTPAPPGSIYDGMTGNLIVPTSVSRGQQMYGPVYTASPQYRHTPSAGMDRYYAAYGNVSTAGQIDDVHTLQQ